MRQFLFQVALLSAPLLACSGEDENSGSESGGAKGGGSGGLMFGVGGSGSGAGAGSGSGAGSNGCDLTIDDECAGETYVGETIPLDIYVMFDQSGSMLNPVDGGGTRMDAVRSAVGQFLNDSKSVGMGVGIGYFGHQAIGSASCDPSDYGQAHVEMGTLPGNAQSLIDSLESREPTGETPTGAAIRGACTYAKAWADDNPSHQVVILLVTDGKPEAPVTCMNGSGPCCPTLQDANMAAGKCLDSGLKTYVLGVGPNLENLEEIAKAGGTKAAYLVSGNADVADQVLTALNAIRSAAQIPCELQIPDAPAGQELDLTRINIVHSNSACEARTIGYREAPASCDSMGGWYFDDPDAPTKVKLCPSTCDDVSLPGARMLFTVGCERVEWVR